MTRTGYEAYEAAGELLRALAAPIRVAIVTELAAGERCVHELVEQLGAPQPLVSQHLRVLRGAGVVRGSRRGREIAYSLVDEHIAHIVADAVSHAGEGRPLPASTVARPRARLVGNDAHPADGSHAADAADESHAAGTADESHAAGTADESHAAGAADVADAADAANAVAAGGATLAGADTGHGTARTGVA